MRLFSFVIAMLISCPHLMAQSQWLHIWTGPEQTVIDAITEDESGNPIAILNYLFDGTSSRIVRFSKESGSVLDQTVLDYPDSEAYAAQIVGRTATGNWLLIGSITSSSTDPDDSIRVTMFQLDSGLVQLSANTAGVPAVDIAYTQALLHPDSTIRVVYQTFDDSFQAHQFQGLTLDIEGNELQSLELHEVASFPSIGSLSLLPNGNVLMATTNAYEDEDTGTFGILQEYGADWLPLSVHGLPMVDPSTALSQNGPNWPMNALVLPNGTVIVSSYYWKCFCDDQRSVIQRVTKIGELLAQWTVDSPFDKDLPAWNKALDLQGSNVFFARMNNWSLNGFNGTVPSQVEVFKMDTSLNIVGTFLLDGFQDNTYYFPASVNATPDGSVYIGGSLRNLNTPNSLPQGWIAKIGADSFVSVNERSKPSASLYPNPGAESFQLVLGEPISNGRLELHDVHGKLLHSETLTGANAQVTVPSLMPGVYCVSLRNASGTSILQQRWVKQ